jgi:hypothetical protein
MVDTSYEEKLTYKYRRLLRANTKHKRSEIGFMMIQDMIQIFAHGDEYRTDPEELWRKICEISSRNETVDSGPLVNLPEIPEDDEEYDMSSPSEAAIQQDRHMQIPPDAERDKLDVRYWIHAVYSIYRRKPDNNVKVAIDVADNGSCAYQAVIYSLLLAQLVGQEIPKTTSALKFYVLRQIYDVQFNQPPETKEIKPPEDINEIARGNSVFHNNTDEGIYTFEMACKSFGVVYKDGKWLAHRSVWADDMALEMIAYVFNVQIVTFTCQFMNRNSSNKTQVQINHVTRGTRGLSFSNVPVLPLLITGSHYYILSRYPLQWDQSMVHAPETPTQHVQSNGRGIEGIPIPMCIEVSRLVLDQQAIHRKLPIIRKCMACNKYILN